MNIQEGPLNKASGIHVSIPSRPIASERITPNVRQLVARLLARRNERPWVSLVAVPLALMAATLDYQFWLIPPLIAVCWWYASTDWVWTWILGLMQACYGIQWAYLGIAVILTFPHDLPVVGFCWAAYAGLVAVVGQVNRRNFSKPYGW